MISPESNFGLFVWRHMTSRDEKWFVVAADDNEGKRDFLGE